MKRVVFQNIVKCKKCGTLGHIARTCTNAVDASFGEEERWAAANVEEIAAEENATGEENATIAEENAEAIEAAAWYVCILLFFIHLFSFFDVL